MQKNYEMLYSIIHNKVKPYNKGRHLVRNLIHTGEKPQILVRSHYMLNASMGNLMLYKQVKSNMVYTQENVFYRHLLKSFYIAHIGKNAEHLLYRITHLEIHVISLWLSQYE